MAHVWIENGPASRRTLVLCMVLGTSVAVHRVVVGLRPATASAGDVIASVPDSASERSGLANPASQSPSASPPAQSGGPSTESGKPEAAPPRDAPRVNPYARRLWVRDPFRSPNVLRLGAAPGPEVAAARPFVDGPATQELLSRAKVEHEVLANGSTRVCINMSGLAAAEPTPPEMHRAVAKSQAPHRRSGPPRRVATTPKALAPSVFAFAGHDLSREEGRRWTLALAFEGRGD